MRTKAGSKGFTLIEVVTVVAIIGILSAVVLPTIMATIPRYRLRAEARELLINFKKAKIEAVKHNRDAVILFTDAVGSQGGSYQMFVNMDKDTSTPHTFDAGDISLGGNQVGQNMKLVSNFTNDQAGFDSRGMPLQFNTVDIGTSDGKRTYQVIVSSAGNVRLQ
jgi:type IV fimbrial biogenesis protein FimT